MVRSRLATRHLTGHIRLLPDFIILGGQRCGTSSLYKYLGRHPQIAPSLRKETEYFTVDFGRGETWYRAHFPLAARRMIAERRGRTLLTFEATPDYLVDPRAPERVGALIPEAKLIVMLREPIERAYSHYRHMVRLGFENLSFRDAIEAEGDRLSRDIEMMRIDPLDRVPNFRRYSYVLRGQYSDQIVRWLGVFPREQVHIMTAEDFFEHPDAALHRLERFIGVDQWSPPEFVNYSYTSGSGADNPDLPPDLRSELRDCFTRSNADLERLTGITVPWATEL